jgi:hypothetical protein
MLPLVMGSLTVPVALFSVLAVVALWERSPRDAVVLVAVELVAIIAAWVLSGQSWLDLPRYLAAQLPIFAGYTDAMGVTGPQEEILAYLGVALVLVCAMWVSVPFATKWRILLATVAVLFLCFKAAFVRHDAHALIAAGALLLLGFLAVVQRLSVVSVLALAASLAGWAYIAGAYEPMDPLARADRFTRAITQSVGGLVARVSHAETLAESFRMANEGIARREPLPAAAAKADLYPSNVAVLLANGGRWAPRPVPQSHSAYTPALAALNEAHLRWDGADRIYFGLDPIDTRYPSMEDGSSWPVLLASYEPAGFAGSYAVLKRRSTPSKVEIGTPVFDGVRTLGAHVPIPEGSPVWAQIDVEPTLLGRLAALVFKAPPLTILVRYSDRTSKAYRFVPGLARGGFLLSPTVASPRDFVALQSARSQELLSGKVPVSFAVRGASGTRFFWNRSYSLRMAPIHIDPAPAADQSMASQQAAAGSAVAATLAPSP